MANTLNPSLQASGQTSGKFWLFKPLTVLWKRFFGQLEGLLETTAILLDTEQATQLFDSLAELRQGQLVSLTQAFDDAFMDD